MPKPEFSVPVAEPQLATVISNTDPKGQGRITVRFDWQLHDTTDWIRVMTPDAGSSGKVSKNRGFMAIPEVGDQVMIGFQHNHPDRPFVMGGMFHGKVGAGGGINNHMRSIQTKSGIKILMNDDEKSITIKDPSGNTWYMDGQGNIEVTAPKNITLNAGENITMSAGNNVSVSASMDITSNAGANYNIVAGKTMNQTIGLDYNLMAANITQFAKKDFMAHSEFLTKTAEKIQAMALNGNITFNAQNTIIDNSGENSFSK